MLFRTEVYWYRVNARASLSCLRLANAHHGSSWPRVGMVLWEAGLHDDAPAGLVAAAAVAGLSALGGGRRLDDSGDGGGDAGRHVCGVVDWF
jgi:hypothetical protein